jgi:hypothetical protein
MVPSTYSVHDIPSFLIKDVLKTKDYTIAIFRIPTNHVVLSYNNKQWLLTRSPVLTFIKLLSTIFVLALQNCPIRKLFLLDKTFWLVIFQVRLRSSYSKGLSLDTTLCNKVCQWLATGRWFSPGTPVSPTNKTDRHDISEILLKVV